MPALLTPEAFGCRIWPVSWSFGPKDAWWTYFAAADGILDFVSNPRFRPRDLSEEPEGFGKVATLVWRKAEGRAVAQVAAAFQQHTYALRIRRAVKDGDRGLKIYALAAGTGYDRLMKLLRGDVVMRLEDVAMADWLLGAVSEFEAPNLPERWGRVSEYSEEELNRALAAANHSIASRAAERSKYRAILGRPTR